LTRRLFVASAVLTKGQIMMVPGEWPFGPMVWRRPRGSASLPLFKTACEAIEHASPFGGLDGDAYDRPGSLAVKVGYDIFEEILADETCPGHISDHALENFD
jgi:hypothetical protein